MPDSYHRTKRRLHAFVIAPRSVASGTEVHLAGGVYPNHANHDELDKLRDIARDLLTQVYRIEGTNRATITEILRATLAGEDVYNDTALEFFELYGIVQQTLGISDSDGHHVTHLKMTALIESKETYQAFEPSFAREENQIRSAHCRCMFETCYPMEVRTSATALDEKTYATQ